MMKRHSLAIVVIGLLALISETVQSAKYGQGTSSVFQDADPETTSIAPSVVVSSSSSKRKGSYASQNYGNSNYYDYTPSVEYAPAQSPYYSKYYSDSLPSYTRQQRYVNPEYLSDGIVAAQNNGLAYSLPPSFTIADSSGERYVTASSHSSGHGHGHGSGHGWQPQQHTNYKISAVNTDAIGLLGLLGLLGILQAVLLMLTTTTTTAATTGRKKRDVNPAELSEQTQKQMTIETLMRFVLPSLNVVAQARIGKVSVNCTQREICKTNQFLVANLGVEGKIASYRITDAMEKMIRDFDKSPTISASIKKAGRMGQAARSSKDCENMYPICKDLRSNGVYSVPVLLPPSHPLYYDNVKAGKQAK